MLSFLFIFALVSILLCRIIYGLGFGVGMDKNLQGLDNKVLTKAPGPGTAED